MTEEMAELHRAINELQRSLGVSEGQNGQIIAKLNAIITGQIKHEDRDREEFNDVRQEQERNRAALEKKIAELSKDQVGDDKSMDERVKKLETDQARAKSAGWAVLAMMGGLASMVGGAVVSALHGHITFKWP